MTATLAPDELLVAVEAAVVSAPELLALDLGTGRTPGGAAVGTVVAAGQAATDRVGQRVLVGPFSACGECEICRRGRPSVCPARVRLGFEVDGALAPRVVARSRWVTALAGPLAGAVPGPEAAALAREAPLSYEMLARAGVAPGETTIWLGDGAVARFGRALATSKGALAVELTPEELALPPNELGPSLRARLSTGTQPPALPWKIFETSGRAAGRARAAALAGAGGTAVLLSGDAAGTRDPWPAPPELLDDDVTLIAVAGAHPDLVPEIVALAVRGELDPAAAVELHPFAARDEVIAGLRAGRGTRLPVVLVG